MKTLIVFFAVLVFAISADAAVPTHGASEEQVTLPPLGVEFYCQEPHIYLQTFNASTAYASEVADDIPDDFYCTDIIDVVFYVTEWGGFWIDPPGVTVNFYNAECPPAQGPYESFYFNWADIEKELIYDSPGSFTCYRVQVYLPYAVHIEYDMSIGFVVETTWGQTAPYAGVVMTNDYDVAGDCEAYWSPEHWGWPRWTAISDYLGTPLDVAYCLSGGAAGGDVIFGDCYIDGGIITVYFFSVLAGTLPINDLEICAFIDDEPALVYACSVPGSWYCHFDPGSNCVYYHTVDNPVPPGEEYGPFDIWIDPPYCYSTLTAIWTLTLDGTVVAGPETSYWHCGPTATAPATWGTIKSLYR